MGQMPTNPQRVVTSVRRRVAVAALVALTLAVASAPALSAAPGPASASASERSWAADTVERALAGDAPVGLDRRARSGLRAMPPGATVAFHPGTGLVRFLAGSRRAPLAREIELHATARRLDLLTAGDRALAAPAGGARIGTARADGAAPRRAGALTPATAARAFLSGAAPLFGVDRLSDLATAGVTSLPDGRAAVRLQQERHGIPIIGGELIVHLDRRGGDLERLGRGAAVPRRGGHRVAPVRFRGATDRCRLGRTGGVGPPERRHHPERGAGRPRPAPAGRRRAAVPAPGLEHRRPRGRDRPPARRGARAWMPRRSIDWCSWTPSTGRCRTPSSASPEDSNARSATSRTCAPRTSGAARAR